MWASFRSDSLLLESRDRWSNRPIPERPLLTQARQPRPSAVGTDRKVIRVAVEFGQDAALGIPDEDAVVVAVHAKDRPPPGAARSGHAPQMAASTSARSAAARVHVQCVVDGLPAWKAR
jgi:hypothetical protein